MKEIALIILMFVCLTISGQTISQPNNRYRGSDMLEKKQIVLTKCQTLCEQKNN